MIFSVKKQHLLRPEKERAGSTFLIALAVAAAFFVPFMIYDNGYFLFYGDFNVQQVPFYQMCHEMIKSGRMSWNWNTDLGVNFIGSYSFYLLGSPFFWLTIPFPNSFVPYLMGPLLILKFACSAFTAYLYIRRFTKSSSTAQLCSLLYAFSGFSVYNVFFNHFHEAIIVFPLLLLAIELLLTENRRGVFALTVCLCAVTNYFFFFGMVVFAIIYWIIRVVSGRYKITLKNLCCFFIEAILGLGLSMFLLYPSIIGVMSNSRLDDMLIGWNAIMYGKEQIYFNIFEVFFFPPDLPARPVFFPSANVKWSSLGGWMPIFSMVGVFAWVRCKRGSWLKRIIFVLTFMAMVPILNSAFYMFNVSYYARWFYMPILMMALATAMAIEDREVEWNGAFNWVAGITLAITLVIGLFPNADNDGKLTFGLFTDNTNIMYIGRFWLACGIAILSLVVLRILMIQLRKDTEKFIRNATVAVCVVSIVYAALFIGFGKTHGYESKEVMIAQLVEGEVDLGQSDENVFRIDVYEGVDNTGMYLGLYSINAFHSIVPAGVTEFYEYVGEERGVGSRPTCDSYAIRSLLSCKYLLSRIDGDSFEEDEETKMPGWSYYTAEEGYHIYENDNYIPLGFTYDYYMSEATCEEYDGSDRANLMLKAILLDNDQINKYGYLLRDIKEDYNFGDGYDSAKRYPNMTEEGFSEDCKNRAETAAQSFEINDNGFVSRIALEKDNLVFFSVPYDEGWSATVNGEPVNIEKVNVGFMAVKAEAGDNLIEFKYKTPGLVTGVIISGAFLVVTILYLLIAKKVCNDNSPEDAYPEGDELIAKWQEYDMQDAIAAAALEESDSEDEWTEDMSEIADEYDFSDLMGTSIEFDEYEQNDIGNDSNN